jgi:ubiquinone/menaquinone biosynthesis C-methylase UbiE
MPLFALNSIARKDAAIGTGRFLVPPRREEDELLEQGVGTQQDVATNLREMWRINRYLGGLNALTGQLFPLLAQHHKHSSVSVVDLGTGSAEVARHIGRWAQRKQRNVQVYGIDVSARNLEFARRNTVNEPNVHLLQLDLNALPFARQQVDYFISSLVLHHFTPAQVVTLLRESYAQARRGIVMNDLTRGYLPLLGFRLIQPVFARHYLTRHDGMVSIRRAYTPAELRQLAHEAGLTTARVVYNFPFRMTLVAEKPYG